MARMTLLLLPVSFLTISAPYDFQAFQREIFIDLLYGPRRARNQLGLAAGRDHFGVGAKLRRDSSDDPIDQARETIVQAGLNAVHRVLADEALGFAQVHQRKTRGLCEQAANRHADARA